MSRHQNFLLWSWTGQESQTFATHHGVKTQPQQYSLGSVLLILFRKRKYSPYGRALHPQVQTTMDGTYWGKEFQKVPKSKTRICHTPTTVYTALTMFYEYPRGDLKCTGGLRRLYANTTLFYIKDLSICEFGGRGVLEPIPSGYPGTTVTEAKLNKA